MSVFIRPTEVTSGMYPIKSPVDTPSKHKFSYPSALKPKFGAVPRSVRIGLVRQALVASQRSAATKESAETIKRFVRFTDAMLVRARTSESLRKMYEQALSDSGLMGIKIKEK